MVYFPFPYIIDFYSSTSPAPLAPGSVSRGSTFSVEWLLRLYFQLYHLDKMLFASRFDVTESGWASMWVLEQTCFPINLTGICSDAPANILCCFPSHLYHSSLFGHILWNDTKCVFNFLAFFPPINSVITVNIPNWHWLRSLQANVVAPINSVVQSTQEAIPLYETPCKNIS